LLSGLTFSILMIWIKSNNIQCPHGFSTRHGGISPQPFNSLNLGGSHDQPENILQNRQMALQALKLADYDLCYLNQVHGKEVCVAKAGEQTGDALVSNQKKQVLAIGIADCYPILFYDAHNAVIGAAHAGWRGTLAKIAEHTLKHMLLLGADLSHIQVAIGQGISQNKFEVGAEVIAQFEAAGFEKNCWQQNKIDLAQSNREVLLKAGIAEKNIWVMQRCTYEDDFFSYRRDKGITGRMWAVIALP